MNKFIKRNMFTNIDYLKINVPDYVNKYISYFENLVHQKVKDRRNKIDTMMEQIKDKKIFSIDGDHSFQQDIYDDIKIILQVKPGRLLIKELMNTVNIFRKIPDNNMCICIKSGKNNFRHSLDNIIEIKSNYCNKSTDLRYNALLNSNIITCIKPKSMILAHELIHELHYRKLDLETLVHERNLFYKNDSNYSFLDNIKLLPNPKFRGYSLNGFESCLVFKKFSNLEEQHTILGVNIEKFIRNSNQIGGKSIILSENVILCAFGLLPRIDHQKAANNSVQENFQINDLSSYYLWLSTQLNQRNTRIEEEFPHYK